MSVLNTCLSLVSSYKPTHVYG
uniref:Uncharacterized protein n=1 Tax=Anguilla anguilla TaxID=7936 RepID=A0A0E9PSX4_ANGAN